MNSPNNSIEVVSFDLWQTLIRGNTTAGKSRSALLHEMLVSPLTLEDFTSVLKAVDDEVDKVTEQDGGHFGPEERLDALCDRLEIGRMSDTQKNDFYSDRTDCLMDYPPMLLDPETIPVLEELSQHYELAIISNTGFINGQEMRRALDKIGILGFFAYQLFSNELDASKPNPRIFEILLDQAKVRPENVAHIGDNPRADVLGAESVGIRGILRTKDTPLREVLGDLLDVTKE